MPPNPRTRGNKHEPERQMYRENGLAKVLAVELTYQPIPEKQRDRKRHGCFFGAERQHERQECPNQILSVRHSLSPTHNPAIIKGQGKEIEKRHEAGCAAGNVGDSFRLDRVKQKEECRPERDVFRVFGNHAGEYPVNKKPGPEMEQKIQHMVTGRIVSINRPVNEECGVQQRSHHVIEMTDKRGPSIKMRVDENREKVVILECTTTSAAIDGSCDGNENGVAT